MGVSLNADDLGWSQVGRYSSSDDAEAMVRECLVAHPNWEVRMVIRKDQLDKQFVVQWRYAPKHGK